MDEGGFNNWLEALFPCVLLLHYTCYRIRAYSICLCYVELLKYRTHPEYIIGGKYSANTTRVREYYKID